MGSMSKSVLLGLALAVSSLVILLLFCTLSFPWYAEVAEVDGTFSSLYFAVATHAFYWSYYCEGNGCSALELGGKDPNGTYSWYDACTDCDNQLTLYIWTWVSI